MNSHPATLDVDATGQPRFMLAGVPVDNLREDDVVEEIERIIAGGPGGYLAVVNAAKVVAATRDPRLRDALNSARLVAADGMSVVWAGWLLGRRLKGRVTGIDTMLKVVERAAGRGFSTYFLGATRESVSKTVAVLLERYPNLRVAGFRDGYFDSSESNKVAFEIGQTGAQILFVALGSPAQEIWLASNLPATGARFAMGVGGSFDHISGRVKRAPRWMQKSGLEWVHRLVLEPRRLWRRYLVGNLSFLFIVLRQFIIRRPVARTNAGD